MQRQLQTASLALVVLPVTKHACFSYVWVNLHKGGAQGGKCLAIEVAHTSCLDSHHWMATSLSNLQKRYSPLTFLAPRYVLLHNYSKQAHAQIGQQRNRADAVCDTGRRNPRA